MVYCGRVVRKPFAVGSKSERDAVMLETDGGTHVLRRVGGNAFADPQLDQLVGHVIECEGELHGYTLLMTSWRDAPCEGSRPA